MVLFFAEFGRDVVADAEPPVACSCELFTELASAALSDADAPFPWDGFIFIVVAFTPTVAPVGLPFNEDGLAAADDAEAPVPRKEEFLAESGLAAPYDDDDVAAEPLP